MGTDNLFHKRKARLADSLRRKKGKRDPYERILIVCEGSKTEPRYFKELRKAFHLNPMNVVIANRRHGLDPLNVVDHALEEYEKDPEFNFVYCVFDRDQHQTYHNALNKIRGSQIKGGVRIKPIVSTPCFEIWLLLHFIYTTKPFVASCGGSNCDLVISELRKFFPTIRPPKFIK